MSASSDTFDGTGWTRPETMRLMDALPLLDEPATEAAAFHKWHWIPAAVALALFVLARLDLLPAMPW